MRGRLSGEEDRGGGIAGRSAMVRLGSAGGRRRGALALVCSLAVLLAIGVMGCWGPLRPKERNITGVVRWRTMAPVDGARVWINGTRLSTISDSVGQYTIAAPADSDSVTLMGAGRTVFETCTGRVRVAVGHHGAVADIVLYHCTPF